MRQPPDAGFPPRDLERAERPPRISACILVVDSEASVRTVFASYLRAAGYDVVEAATGSAALAFVGWRPDLVLLELDLPDMHGLDVLRQMKLEGTTAPVLVLSSIAEEGEKLRAFEAGVDDYVTKPFSAREVMARINVALRWSATIDIARPVFRVGDLSVDVGRRIVKIGGVEANLSPKEFKILSLLTQNAGKVLSQSYLLMKVWAAGTDPQYLRTYIGQIRRKIENMPEEPYYIRTVNGVGYRMRSPDEDGRHYLPGPGGEA